MTLDELSSTKTKSIPPVSHSEREHMYSKFYFPGGREGVLVGVDKLQEKVHNLLAHPAH